MKSEQIYENVKNWVLWDDPRLENPVKPRTNPHTLIYPGQNPIPLRAQITKAYYEEKPFLLDIRDLQMMPEGNEIRDLIIDNPEETLKAINQAINHSLNHDWQDKPKRELYARLTGFVPDPYIHIKMGQQPTWQTQISKLGVKNLGKVVVFNAQIKSKTQLIPTIDHIIWECPACGNNTGTYAKNERISHPFPCRCGNKGWKPTQKKIIPKVVLKVEESYEDKPDDLHTIHVVLKNDIAEYDIVKNLTRGKRIKVIGLYCSKEIIDKRGKTCDLEPYIECNNIELLEDVGDEIKVTKDDETQIKQLANTGNYTQYWANTLFTGVHGHQAVKESIVVQLVGNPPVVKGAKRTRGDIHQILIGDAACSKSTLIKMACAYAIKARYAAGGSSTSVGITGTVIKDEFSGAWVVEAGALPLTNNGILGLDEAEKMDKTEIARLHEALEQQEVTIDKGNVHTTLRCKTRLLAAANPKYGNFDPHSDMYDQIEFTPTFLNRFDLIWVLIDTPDKETDGLIAKNILSNLFETETSETVLLFKKYLKLSEKLRPKPTPQVLEDIQEWYSEVRSTKMAHGLKIRINARSLESVSRLMSAHARAELKDTIDKTDLDWAINIYIESLKFSALDTLTGTIDVQKIQAGVSLSQSQLYNTIIEFVRRSEHNLLSFEEIKELLAKNVTETDLERTLDRLCKEGMLFQPRPGQYKCL